MSTPARELAIVGVLLLFFLISFGAGFGIGRSVHPKPTIYDCSGMNSCRTETPR